VLWHCWLGGRKDILPVKNWVMVFRWCWSDWRIAWIRVPDCTTPISIISCYIKIHKWTAPRKNRISSTTMKLRKSLVKPVTWQNISSCLALLPEIVMHDAFNVILWTSANVCVVVHDNLGLKNRTTRLNCRFSATSLALSDFHLPKTSAEICIVHDDLGCKNRTTRCNRFWRAGCSRLEYVDICSVY